MSLPESFHCLMVRQDPSGKGVVREVTTAPLEELPPGDVLIRTAWSSLNYKDALSALGHPGVTRKFPHVPGIDVAGVVAESRVPEFREGDEVLVTGFDLGQNTWGGYGEYCRVPKEWVVPLPQGLSLRESMIYGTAGVTAGMCLRKFLERVLPEAGEIVVTGASGGVGSVAVALFAQAGYRVAAVTGKPEAAEYLKKLGAERIVARQELHDESGKPLLTTRWAGGVDTVGGNVLSTLIRSLMPGGLVTACGLVGGAELPLTVYPFILRGVELAGIDSANFPAEKRRGLWHKLAREWRTSVLAEIATAEVDLAGLEEKITEILAGKVHGRVLVKVERREEKA